MTRDEIIAMIRKNAEAIKAEGVTKLAIFGSRVRGDNRADSDLDCRSSAGRVVLDSEPHWRAAYY
jgi:predicted nucleotidyltransferase